jgi:hypothetical protein
MTILTLLWRFTIGGAWKYLAAGAGVLALYFKGRSDAKAKADSKAMKEDIKAHERINEADLGVGATDSERIERLREFAAKHGNGQAKGKGG